MELRSPADELSRLLSVESLVERYGVQSPEARAWFSQVRTALARVDRAQAAEFDGLAARVPDLPSWERFDPLRMRSLLLIYGAIAQSQPPSPPGADERDELTGLGRRSAFYADLAHRVEAAVAGRRPLALVLCDLDQFNRVNYDAGPPAGDEILRAVAAEVAAIAKGRGHAYRCGGEEMAALLPGMGGADGAVVAEKLRDAVARLEVPALGRPVTASIGVAAVPDHAGDPAALFEKAVCAVDRAREGGRNQVRLAE